MGLPPSDLPNGAGEVDLTSTLHIASFRSVPDFISEKSLLDSLSSEEFTVLKELPNDCGMFISLAGPGKGARFLLAVERVTIGRDPSSEIFLDDVTVSRKHCQVLRSTSGSSTSFEVEDLKSLNGTYVNAVSRVKTSLNHGDEVQVGKYRFTFFRPVTGQRTGEIL